MRNLFVASAMALLLATGAAAQPAQPTASHLAAAREMLEAMETPTTLRLGIETALRMQLEANPQLQQVEGVMRDFFAKYMTWEVLGDDYAMIYARQFTEAELREMTAFYRTPTGRKAALATPQLMQQGAELGQRAVAEHMDELQAEVIRALTGEGGAAKP